MGLSQLTCPIFLPGFIVLFPYRWSLALGILKYLGQSLTASPIRFNIIVSLINFVLPRHWPDIALINCSNWQVTEPSCVQWPELCGRGASSFMTISPFGSTNISIARIPVRSSASAKVLAISNAWFEVDRLIFAGASVTAKIWLSCWFSTGGYASKAQCLFLATITEISFSNSTNCSSIASCVFKLFQACSADLLPHLTAPRAKKNNL